MTVEALVLVKTKPGKSKRVVSEIAKGKYSSSTDHDYRLKGIKVVYRATGNYDIIVHAEADDVDGIFGIANQIINAHESDTEHREDLAVDPSGQGSSSGQSGSGGQSGTGSNVTNTDVIILCPKPANDP